MFFVQSSGAGQTHAFPRSARFSDIVKEMSSSFGCKKAAQILNELMATQIEETIWCTFCSILSFSVFYDIRLHATARVFSVGVLSPGAGQTHAIPRSARGLHVVETFQPSVLFHFASYFFGDWCVRRFVERFSDGFVLNFVGCFFGDSYKPRTSTHCTVLHSLHRCHWHRVVESHVLILRFMHANDSFYALHGTQL